MAGEVKAKFIENCYVEAGGPVYVENGILNSAIHTLKQVELGRKGVIIGGKIYAQDGVKAVQIGSAMGLEGIGSIFGNMDSAISPEIFQFIIGIYLIEILAILAMFINKISVGENKTSMYYEMGKILIIGLVVYFLVAIGSSTVFGGFIRDALGTLVFGG